MIKILIVDDHEMVRTGLRSILTASDITIVGETAKGGDVMHLVQELEPDIVLLDIQMPDIDGITVLETLHASAFDTRVIMVTTYRSISYLLRALSAGAAGFVLKDISREEMLATVRAVASGKSRVDQTFLQSVLLELNGDKASETLVDIPEPLTKRELEVVQLIVEGMSNPIIGQTLSISIHTVKEHVQNIYQKLQVTNRTEAAVRAIRIGLVK